MNRILVITLVSLFLCTANASAESSPKSNDYPPQPDFKKPVNYEKWMRDRVFNPKAPDGETIFADWLIYGKPDTPLKKAMKKCPEKLNKATHHKWSDADFPEVAKWLDEHKKSLDAFQDTIRTPEVQWLRNCKPMAKQHPLYELKMDAMRSAYKGLVARTWRQDKEGNIDSDSLVAMVEDAFRFAQHVQVGNLDIFPFLLGMSVRSSGIYLIRDGLEAGFYSPDQIRKLISILESRYPEVDMKSLFQMEWCFVLMAVQDSYPDGMFNYHAFKKTTFSEMTYWHDVTFTVFAGHKPEQLAASSEKWFRPILEQVRKGWSASLYRKVYELDGEERRKSLPLAAQMGSVSRLYHMGIRLETERRATYILLSIFDHKNQETKWPAKLTDCPQLKKHPEMMIDPWSGKPFVYRLVDGNPFLYSVSLNETDDGGVPGVRPCRPLDKTGDAIFWPKQSKEN